MTALCVYHHWFLAGSLLNDDVKSASTDTAFLSHRQCSTIDVALLVAPALFFVVFIIIPHFVFSFIRQRAGGGGKNTKNAAHNDDGKENSSSIAAGDDQKTPFLEQTGDPLSSNEPARPAADSSQHRWWYKAADFACFALCSIVAGCFAYKLVVAVLAVTQQSEASSRPQAVWSIVDTTFDLVLAVCVAFAVLYSRLARRSSHFLTLHELATNRHRMLAADGRNGDTRALLFIYFVLSTICRSISLASGSSSSVTVLVIVDSVILGCNAFLMLFYGFLPRSLTSSTSDQPICPLPTASPVSVFTFMWVMPLIYYGWQHTIKIDDIWQIQHSRQAKTLYFDLFRPKWRAALERAKSTRASSVHFAATKSEADEFLPKTANYRPPSFLGVLCSTIIWDYVFGLILLAANIVFKFASPMILKALLASFEKAEENPYEKAADRSPFQKRIILAVILFVCTIVESLLDSHVKFVGIDIGYGMMKTMTMALHEKALKLSNDARRTTTVGRLINLITVDQRIFFNFGNFCYFIVNAPVTIVISIVLIWRELGAAALAGVLVLVVLIPLNSFISTRQQRYYSTQLQLKDERLRQVSEMVHGIRILKLYAWEAPFIARLLKIRAVELKNLRTASLIQSLANMLWTTSSFLVLLATFAAYVLASPADNILTAQKTFVALALFNLLREPMTMLSQLAQFVVQFRISLRRVSAVLLADECDDDEKVLRLPYSQTLPAVQIEKGANFAWSHLPAKNDAESESFRPALRDINLTIKSGSLTAIVGHVGAGKSSLCAAILGQMHFVAPKLIEADAEESSRPAVTVRGSVAYVPQQSWIQNATLFDNIIFMRPINTSKYNRVVDACALRQDLQILPAGDQTEIGEKGLNLSGGQKQSVSLARAAYSGAQVVVLDDPLSAVDAHVGKHIFQQLIANKTGLLKHTTRIMATHNVHLLPFVDNIIVMEHGRIAATGTYHELIRAGGAFADFLSSHIEPKNDNSSNPGYSSSADEQPAAKADDDKIVRLRRESCRTTRTASFEGGSTEMMVDVAAQPSAEQTNIVKKKAKLIEDEHAQLGNVKASVYWTYAKFITLKFATITLALAAVHCVLSVASQIWLAAWSSDVQTTRSADASSQNIYRLSIYAVLGSVDAVTILLQACALAFGALLASRNVHELVLDRVMHAPTTFFDTNPSGRILNRFSADVDMMDVQIPSTLLDVLNALINIAGMLCVVVYGSSLYFLLAAAPLAVMYVVVQRFAVTSTSQLRRLESIWRSPMVSYFGECVQGVHVISAMNMEQRVQCEFMRLYDQATRPQFCYMNTNRGVTVLLKFIGSLIVLAASVFAVIQHDRAEQHVQLAAAHRRADLAQEATAIDSSSAVGLVISNALAVTGTLAVLVQMMSFLENSIISVERMKEYTDIVQEVDREPPTTAAAAASKTNDRKRFGTTEKVLSADTPNWPQTGTVDISNYSARYRPGLDLVLNNISVHIADGEKVGIVGRTGSGKSSLALALFRMISGKSEIQGQIEIDGRNISGLNLFELRSHLSIIPQDPVVFSGTLRFNLDPRCSSNNDDDFWKALRQAHLHEFVTSLPAGLEFQVGSDGHNLSVGQKQLVCLARALLRQSKILVLDEATAAVDLETDELIQQSIRKEFARSTVITIAHRINTIIDYNRVMVLANGRVVEIGAPQELLQKGEESEFYKLAVESARRKQQ